MKLPDPKNVDCDELVDALRMSADIMTRIDGDRAIMNKSRLTCGQVQDAFRLMLIAADKLQQARDVLGWLNARGGLGHETHELISNALGPPPFADSTSMSTDGVKE